MKISDYIDGNFDKVVDELEIQGYRVIRSDKNILEEYADDDLIAELESRDYYFNTKVDRAIELLENRGYKVLEKDKNTEYKEFLFDLYYDIIYKTPEEFAKGVNQILVKEIERWK